MKDTAYDYLNKDKLLHADMLLTLDMQEGDILYAGQDGVLIYNRIGCTYMLSMADETLLPRILPLLTKAELLVLHQTEFKQDFAQALGLHFEMECRQYVYPSPVPPQYNLPEGLELKMISAAEAPFVFEHYSHADDYEYICSRIDQGMLGAYKGEELMGFIGCHGEGSMGLLEVLPKYRRLGLAHCLEAELIARLLSQGRRPYCQVVVGNAASYALQDKLGLLYADKTICWLYRD